MRSSRSFGGGAEEDVNCNVEHAKEKRESTEDDNYGRRDDCNWINGTDICCHLDHVTDRAACKILIKRAYEDVHNS